MLLQYPKYLAITWVLLNRTCCANGEWLNLGCSPSAAYTNDGISGNNIFHHRTKIMMEKWMWKEVMLL